MYITVVDSHLMQQRTRNIRKKNCKIHEWQPPKAPQPYYKTVRSIKTSTLHLAL
jgi:hypothetical protein